MRNNKSDKGFTIIEVVVVLAIAGLIFAIVFWALPNLQKSNRDTTRRNVAAQLMASLETYASNHAGNYPVDYADFDTFMVDFYDNDVKDADGTSFLGNAADVDYYATVPATLPAAVTDLPQLSYWTNAKCRDGIIESASGARSVAITIAIEQGNYFCAANS